VTTYRDELSKTNKTGIYGCGCEEIDWNIDWSDAVLRPGRWRVIEPGSDGEARLLVEWVPPKIAYASDRSTMK
jgi:hypothetical protein